MTRRLAPAVWLGVVLAPAAALGQGLPVQPPATPAEGWGLIVAVLVTAILGLGGLLKWVAARHLKALDETVAEQKTIGGSLREVFTALKAHREEAEARVRAAEERHEQRHGEVIQEITTLRSELGIREQLSRIEAGLTVRSPGPGPGPALPDAGPPSGRGATRRGA